MGRLAVKRQIAVLLNVIFYTAAFSACERGQRWQQALGLLAVMQRSAVLSVVISCGVAISACEIASGGRRFVSLGDDAADCCSTVVILLSSHKCL